MVKRQVLFIQNSLDHDFGLEGFNKSHEILLSL